MCGQDQHIELLLYKLDTNCDGVISLDEFVGGYDQYIFVMGKRTDFGPFFEKNKILPELQTNDIGI